MIDYLRDNTTRTNPRIEFNLKKLQHNVFKICTMCLSEGIKIVGITKGFSAIPEVAKMMIAGGIEVLGDSRLENIQSLREAGIKSEMVLTRIPMLHETDRVVELVTCSLNSEIATMKKLSHAAIKQGKIHDILLMVDLGDLREGVLPDDVLDTVKEILTMKGVCLKGLGSNFNCLSGIDPTEDNLMELINLSSAIEKKFGIKLETASGGSTSSLALIVKHSIPEKINQLRIGEGILLGHSDIFTNLDDTYQDAITITAEIIELKLKHSSPRGTITRDSFGRLPTFKANGIRKRAILAIGKQDIYPDHLSPIDKDITIIGASSDHLVVDVTKSRTSFHIGDEIQFIPTYPGILSSTTSKFVNVYTNLI